LFSWFFKKKILIFEFHKSFCLAFISSNALVSCKMRKYQNGALCNPALTNTKKFHKKEKKIYV